MIHRLTLGNFKPFRDTHEAPLAPITLVYGPNSAGKSSLIQSLLLLEHTLVYAVPWHRGVIRLRLHNPWLDLGSWQGLLHGHDTSRDLVLGCTYRFSFAPLLGYEPNQHDHDQDPLALEGRVLFTFRTDDVPDATHLPILHQIDYILAPKDHSPIGFSFQLITNKILQDDSEDAPGKEDLSYQWSRDDLDSFLQLLTWLRDHWKRTILSGPPDKRGPRPHPALTRLFEALNADALAPQLSEALRIGRSGLPSFGEEAGTPTNGATVVLQRVHALLSRNIHRVTYLGPLRTPPARLIENPSTFAQPVSPTGAQALAHFCQQPDFYRPRLERWFTALEIPYRIQVRRLPSELFGDLHAIVLTDKRTGVEVATTDVGFGIAQLLPILLTGIASRRETVCVEQPEIHLHPRQQAHLADFFIETRDLYQSQWIIETHSEALILRLQRRIREGKLSPDDVAVLYVEPGEEGSRILHLRLAEDGEFIDEWPEGFFEERYDEMFGGEE